MASRDPDAIILTRPVPQGPQWGQLMLLAAALPIGIYLLLPTLIVLPMALTKGELIQFPPVWISVHAFADYFADPQWIDSTVTSLKVATLAVAIASLADRHRIGRHVIALVVVHGHPGDAAAVLGVREVADEQVPANKV